MPYYILMLEQNFRGKPGYLANLLAAPVKESEKSLMFSVAITGLQAQGFHRVWAMGRMDLLATELVGKTKHLMELRKSSFYDTDWHRIEEALEAKRNDIELLVAFAPHKMVFNGAEMESAADGANERTDIYI